MMHALFYRLWGLLPGLGQEWLIFLLTPKVTLGVAAVVMDGEGRVLLVHHTYRRSPWNFPGGLVERCEQPDAALVREMREELGLDATIGPLLYADNSTQRHHMSLYYRATVTGAPRYNAELNDHRYVNKNELGEYMEKPPSWLRWQRPE
jgi:ADP-ribose pyrophosphatase YjhB (NUDIX family)